TSTGDTQVTPGAHDGGALLAGVSAEDTQRLLRAFRVNIEAARGYRPRPYKGPALLIQAVSSDKRPERDHASRWLQLVPHLQIQQIEGDHYSLLKESAAERLAESLRMFACQTHQRPAAASP